MGDRDDIARLMKEAAGSMKSDLSGAVAKLESAFAIAKASGDADDTATVAEELARAWARRKSASKSLYYACKATKLSPTWKTAWTTLAKTCELIASRTRGESHERRTRALYRAAAQGFKKAASLTTDKEDKHWLIELARDAAAQANPDQV